MEESPVPHFGNISNKSEQIQDNIQMHHSMKLSQIKGRRINKKMDEKREMSKEASILVNKARSEFIEDESIFNFNAD